MTTEIGRRFAVVCYWSPYLALVALDGGAIVMARTSRVRGGDAERAKLAALVARFVAKHSLERVVIEPRTVRRLGLTLRTDSLVMTLSLSEAKRILLGGGRHTHGTLYRHLLTERPELRAFVTVAPDTGRIGTARPWQTVKLLAVALALAGLRSKLKA